nr:MAG TPA: hypothetical protein [Caudoviricetes sp.]
MLALKIILINIGFQMVQLNSRPAWPTRPAPIQKNRKFMYLFQTAIIIIQIK